MTGKTLTRADLAEAVVEKVGLPRNESQDLVELVLDEISGSLAGGDSVKFLLAFQAAAHGPQSEDRQGSSNYTAPRVGVPPVEHHERSYQQGP